MLKAIDAHVLRLQKSVDRSIEHPGEEWHVNYRHELLFSRWAIAMVVVVIFLDRLRFFRTKQGEPLNFLLSTTLSLLKQIRLMLIEKNAVL